MAEKEYIERGMVLELLKDVDRYGYLGASDINSVPAADVAPVRHGRWVDKLVRDWHCSECGKKVPRQVYFDGYCYADKLNYCPNCGAKMDLEGGDGNG